MIIDGNLNVILGDSFGEVLARETEDFFIWS